MLLEEAIPVIHPQADIHHQVIHHQVIHQKAAIQIMRKAEIMLRILGIQTVILYLTKILSPPVVLNI